MYTYNEGAPNRGALQIPMMLAKYALARETRLINRHEPQMKLNTRRPKKTKAANKVLAPMNQHTTCSTRDSRLT